MAEISGIRKEYTLMTLNASEVDKDPLIQFGKWFEAAVKSAVNEPNAMGLSTVSANGKPHSRIVLLKDYSSDGLSFFTNYKSEKGKEIEGNNYVSLLFFWPELERQVRVEGTVSKLDRKSSEQYFQSRPRGSQIGAYASAQSEVIPNKKYLEEKLLKLESSFANIDPIPLPDFWGGYLVKPLMYEFWQGRPSRLHDRVKYTLVNSNWKIELLSP
ncbi:MAG: pyridoxamine 5'-phosphate oxidase [Bacteroidota bacterium]|nr:pyridoxamine 5'-phosphate oxidase [Bacteroidota bacterium]